VLFTFNITEDVYNNTTDTFVRVMSQPVDLSDFQFGISGVVVRCTIDESGVSYTGTTPDVLPVWSEGTIYSKTYSPGVSFDGACFVNPVLVETLDANSGAIAEPIVGCHDPDCGPQGVYCYTETCSPYTAIITVVQPLYHPAPFVASPANQYLCYGTPVFKNAGSLYVEGGGTVAANTKIFAYADSSLCGLVSVYGMCNTGDLLGVVYPCATVPHDYVKYSDSCYAFQYTATTFNVELPGLNFINFNNWMTQGGTFDLIGSTPVYELFDLVPGNGMYTDLLGSPTTNFGTLVSKQAWELTAGDYAIDIIFAGNQRTDPNPTPFSIGVTVGSYGTAWYENGKEMPFETRQLAFTVAGSEYATVNVFQNTASLWGGVYNAGNLLKSVHLYRTAPTADDLLIENFEYTPIPPLPDTVVSVSDVTVVADCQDVACTGSNFLGDAMLYTLSETGSLARVAFDGLDMGIPHFGVAVKATSTGLNGLAAGSLAFVISKSRQTIIRQVAGTGVLAFGLTLTGTDKTFIRKRGGTETRYFLPAGRGSVTIDVVPGDTIYLDFGRVGVRTFKRPCVVVWQPRVAPLREYDTAVLNESGSIKALGFCGLTNRSDYTVFSTLPVDAQTDDVVNPDALVTVSGSDGIQYALVRNAAYNEAKPPLPFNWYAGQTLNGSMTFHFYASRKTYGAHGEMDVWTTTDGTFPEFFRISEFFGLSGSNAVRVDSQDGDIRRNGLQVVASLDGIERPGQYRASDGELRTFDPQSGTVSTDKIFSLVGIDEGISFKIYESPPPPPPFSIFLDAFRVSLDDGATYIPKPLSGGFITFGSAPPLFNYSFNGIKVPTYPLMQITYTVTPLSLGDYVLEWTGLNMSGMLGADLIPQLNAIGLSGVGASVRFTSWVDPGNQPFAKTLLVGDIIRTSTGNSNVLSSVLVPAHYPYSITYRIRIHATSMFPYSGGIFFLPH
jgi:hypothetical protein